MVYILPTGHGAQEMDICKYVTKSTTAVVCGAMYTVLHRRSSSLEDKVAFDAAYR